MILGSAAILRQWAEVWINGADSAADYISVNAIDEAVATIVSSHQVVTLR